MPTSRAVRGALLVMSFLVVAAIQAWPLPRHLSTRLTGDPGGDTGVYVWNTWVFRHELVTRHASPLSTDTVLPLEGSADLSQHNYTIASNLLTLPLQPVMGVVAAFNIVYLINVALCGVGLCLLARRLGRSAGVGWLEAWLAGLLFACSPFLVARGTAHFSLASAAALPFLAYWVDRLWHGGGWREGAIAGACLAWAAYSDPYYAVYGGLLVVAMSLGHTVSISWRRCAPTSWTRRVLDWAIGVLVVIVVARLTTGIASIDVAGHTLSMRTLYTPVLMLAVLALVRAGLTWRPRTTWTPPAHAPSILIGMATLSGVTLFLLGPELVALVFSAGEGRFVAAPVLWRSSAPGVDLVSFLLPNPNHPLAPRALVDWFANEPGRYEENVVSIPWVSIAVIVAAWRLAGHRPNRLWLGVAIASAALALGPFLRVAHIETVIPTPWTLARYVPIIEIARMPARFGVLAILGVSVVFAMALAALRLRAPQRSRQVTVVVAALLVFELLPAPRRLYSAEIPAAYDTIAADPRDVRVLQLPFGIRDGLSSLGNFSSRDLLYQTRHGKGLVGGYLSRVPDNRKTRALAHPYLRALIVLSEGRPLDDDARAAAEAAAAGFVHEFRIGYVAIETGLSPDALTRFATDSLRLRLESEDGTLRVFVPEVGSDAIPR